MMGDFRIPPKVSENLEEFLDVSEYKDVKKIKKE
jgi:hypothetical protein